MTDDRQILIDERDEEQKKYTEENPTTSVSVNSEVPKENAADRAAREALAEQANRIKQRGGTIVDLWRRENPEPQKDEDALATQKKRQNAAILSETIRLISDIAAGGYGGNIYQRQPYTAQQVQQSNAERDKINQIYNANVQNWRNALANNKALQNKEYDDLYKLLLNYYKQGELQDAQLEKAHMLEAGRQQRHEENMRFKEKQEEAKVKAAEILGKIRIQIANIYADAAKAKAEPKTILLQYGDGLIVPADEVTKGYVDDLAYNWLISQQETVPDGKGGTKTVSKYKLQERYDNNFNIVPPSAEDKKTYLQKNMRNVPDELFDGYRAIYNEYQKQIKTTTTTTQSSNKNQQKDRSKGQGNPR